MGLAVQDGLNDLNVLNHLYSPSPNTSQLAARMKENPP